MYVTATPTHNPVIALPRVGRCYNPADATRDSRIPILPAYLHEPPPYPNRRAARPEPLLKLQERGTLAVGIALDEDDSPDTAAKVDASRQALIRECLALGLAVQVYRWDCSDGKGIDDLLLWEGTPRIEIVRSVLPGDAVADSDMEGESGPLSIQQQAVRYRYTRSLILARDGEHRIAAMRPAQKLALLTTHMLTDSFPGPNAPVKAVAMGLIADCMGVGRRTAAESIKSLAEHGLLKREEDRLYKDGVVHTIIRLGAGRKLGFREVLTEPEHLAPAREKAAARRCAECGGELQARYTCVGCGTVHQDSAKPKLAALKFTRKRPDFEAQERSARVAREDEPWTETAQDQGPPEVMRKFCAPIYKDTDAQTLPINSGIQPHPSSSDTGAPADAFAHMQPLVRNYAWSENESAPDRVVTPDPGQGWKDRK